jgi:hypothetical protein
MSATLIFLFWSTSSMAKQKCESEVAANLKPVKESSGFSWAVELTGQLGYLGNSTLDRTLANGMAFMGLHYRADLGSPHQFYFEGGYKDWYKSDDGPGLGGTGQTWGDFPTPAKDHWGLREAYYDFDRNDTQITTGLHAASLDESLLLDERAIGGSLGRSFGSYSLNVTAGSVMTQFARMKDFCATRHVYRVVRGGRINEIGDAFGETNFVGGTLSWSPNQGSSLGIEELPGDDPAEEDAFGAFEDEEFSSLEESETRLVKRLGVIVFNQFGPGFDQDRLFYGGIAEFALMRDFELQLEFIHQHVANERVIGYLIQGERDFTWRSGALTSFWMGYIGSAEIDTGALFRPSFSNLFLGEVMRLDVVNMPLVFGRVSHRLPWRGKPSVGLFAVAQTSAAQTEEYDFESEVNLSRRLRLYGVVGLLRSGALSETTMVGRVQFRYAF